MKVFEFSINCSGFLKALAVAFGAETGPDSTFSWMK